jgi:hypothetical protein
VTCRVEALDPRLPGAFRALADPRPVVVAKRKHGDRHDRWQWDGNLVGLAGRGWRVVRHVRGVDERRLLLARSAEPEAAISLRWLGTRAPATVLVKVDAGRIVEVKVDAALPVPFRRGRFLFTDLDVDVVRDAAGSITVRDWDVFEARAEPLGYTDASRAVARAGEDFGLRLLAAWEPTLERDIRAILAETGMPPAPELPGNGGR